MATMEVNLNVFAYRNYTVDNPVDRIIFKATGLNSSDDKVTIKLDQEKYVDIQERIEFEVDINDLIDVLEVLKATKNLRSQQ